MRSKAREQSILLFTFPFVVSLSLLLKMIRFLQKATIEKIKNKKCAEQEGFERLKKLQILLGHDGKKNAAYRLTSNVTEVLSY